MSITDKNIDPIATFNDTKHIVASSTAERYGAVRQGRYGKIIIILFRVRVRVRSRHCLQ